jgi:hypothetical protein
MLDVRELVSKHGDEVIPLILPLGGIDFAPGDDNEAP